MKYKRSERSKRSKRSKLCVCESAKWFELWRQDKLGWVMNLSKITACCRCRCRGYFPFDKWSGPSVRHDKSYTINIYLRNWYRYLGVSLGRRWERPGQKWIGKVSQVRILGIPYTPRCPQSETTPFSIFCGTEKKPVWPGSEEDDLIQHFFEREFIN